MFANNPRIVTDGLFFCMDANDRESYPNKFDINTGWTDYNSSQAYYTIVAKDEVIIKDTSTNWIGRFGPDTVTAGDWTVMFDYQVESGGSSHTFAIDNDGQNDNLFNTTITATTTKQSFHKTVAITGTGSVYLYIRQLSTGNGDITISNYRLTQAKWGDMLGDNDFTLYNQPDFVTSANGICNFDFDGTNDYAQCVNSATSGNFPIAGEPRTIEVWFTKNNDSSSNAHKGLFGWGLSDYSRAYFLEHNYNEAFLYCYGSADLGPTGGTLVDDQFYCMAAVWDGYISYLYMNGVELTNEVVGGNTSTAPMDTYGGYGPKIGRDGSYNSGYISVARVYNRALVAAELLQNYNAQKSRFNA